MIKRLIFKVLINIVNIIPCYKFFELRNELLRLAGVSIGKGTKIVGPVYFTSSKIKIGNNVWIGSNFKIYSTSDDNIIIGDNVDIAPEVILCCGGHNIGTNERRAGKGYSKGIIIENGSWIGVRTTILGGVNIGKSCIVAANSLVNKDISNDLLVGGVPCREISKLEK